MNLLEKIEQIASESGRNKKIELISECVVDENFRQVFTYALSPFYNFGITPNFNYSPKFERLSIEQALEIIKERIANHNHSNALIETVQSTYNMLSYDDAEVFIRVISKDLKCGAGIGTYNAAIKQYNKTHDYALPQIPTYPCLLASAYDEKLINRLMNDNKFVDCIAQEKYDGMRVNVVAIKNSDNTVTIQYNGRSGKPILIKSSKLDNYFSEIRKLSSCDFVLDGELLVRKNGKILDRKTGNGILNKAVRGTITEEESNNIVMVLWDYIPLEEFEENNYDAEYSTRYSKLDCVLSLIDKFDRVEIAQSYPIETLDDAQVLFNKMRKDGKEGIIIKSNSNMWSDTRARDIIKMKALYECDLLCVDYEYGGGKYDGMLGALVLESSDRKVRVSVGTGFTDQERKELTPKNCIGKIVSVGYNERITDKTKDYDSLFLPRFIEIREDKSVANSENEIE